MANTPGGLPYPVGTDFVVDGDNAIRALAEALDRRVAYGGSMRAYASSGTTGYSTSYIAIPYNTVDTAATFPTAPPGFTFSAANRGFTIVTPGMYLIHANATVGQANTVFRIRAGSRTLALLANSSTLFAMSLSAHAYLAAGTLVTAQIALLSGSGSSAADSADSPTDLRITHLPFMPNP